MKAPSKLVILYLLSLCIVGCLGEFIHAKYKPGNSRNQVISRRYMAEVSDSDRFLEYIKSQNIEVHHTTHNSFYNSISFEIKHLDKKREYATLKSILNHDDVETVSPVHVYKRAVTATSPDIFKASPEEAGYRSTHHLLQIDKVHRELNLTGEGVFIAIVDSGVDYLHPALGGGYGPGYTVQTGYDFVGKNYGSTPGSVPEPDDDPYDDCTLDDYSDGHGTSTTGIIAGYDLANNFTGVAYKAKIGVYKIFGCYGDSTVDIVYRAISKAAEDGANIISISVGSDTPWDSPGSRDSKLFTKLKEKGVILVAATSNDGDLGIYTTSGPSSIESVYSVGGAYNEYTVFDGTFTAAGINGAIDYQILSIAEDGSKIYMPDGELTRSSNETGIPYRDACELNSISPTVKGRIALVRRGGCALKQKSNNVAKAGAIGIITYEITTFSNEKKIPNTAIPYAFISSQDGQRLIDAFKNSTLPIKFSSDRATIYRKNSYGGKATFYTGLGPTAELNLKPNVLAVSEDIYTLLPRYLGSWTLFEGTSGAVPLVAGSMALYMQYMKNKNISVDTAFEQFQNYATIPMLEDNSGLDHPLRAGAGLIQVYDAITQTTHISPARISFNDTSSQDYKIQNLTITNFGQTAVSYRVFNNVSIAIAPYDRAKSGYVLLEIVQTQVVSASLAFSATEIHLQAGQSQILTVAVTPPSTDPLDHIMYGGFIQLDPILNTNTVTTTKSLHVPYFGVVGKQYDLPIMDPSETVTVCQTIDDEKKLADEYVLDFTANKTDLIIERKTLTPTKIITKEIFKDENCTQLLGYAGSNSLFNPPSTFIPWAFTFRGTYTADVPSEVYDYTTFTKTFNDVPSGTYYLRIKFLKLFGELNKENDWEYLKVGPVVIKR